MEYAALRDDMVDSLEHDTKAVVSSTAVGHAMRTVPRHEFVDAEHRAYMDQSFEHRGTTVLSPSLAGRLLDALDPQEGDDVLVVGSGVGYTTAVIAEVVGSTHVHAVDINRPVVYDSRQNLARAGYGNVLVECRDGADGLAEYAPYDRILIEAGAIEPPRAIRAQLADGGRIVFPRGVQGQELVAVEDGEEVANYGPVGFAPLLVDGEQHGTIVRNRTVREEREHAARAHERRKGWEHEWIDWDNAL